MAVATQETLLVKYEPLLGFFYYYKGEQCRLIIILLWDSHCLFNAPVTCASNHTIALGQHLTMAGIHYIT